MNRSRQWVSIAAIVLVGIACSSEEKKPIPDAAQVDTPTQPTNQNPFPLTGSGQADATIAVRGGEQAVATGIIGSDGRFSVPVKLKPNQKNTLFVSVSNKTGEGPAVTVEVTHDGQAPDTPVVDAVVSPIRIDREHIRGTTEANAAVKITGGKTDATGTAGADGRFDIEVVLKSDSAPVKTANELQVTATDVAGNTSSPATVTIEVDPSLPVQAPQLDTFPAATNNASFNVTGIAEPGAGISVVGATAPKSGTAGNDGKFSVPVTLKANQENTLLIFAIGNGVTSDPATVSITHDDVAPAAPSLFDPVSPTGATNITLTGSGEPYASVIVTGAKSAMPSTVDEFGNFSADVLLNTAAGTTTTNTLVITVKDAAGNVSPEVTKTVVQDPNLEKPITVNAIASPTQDEVITLTGSTQAGATVNVTGGVMDASTMVEPSGQFSVEVTLNKNTSNDLHVSRAGGTTDTIVVIVHDDIAPITPELNAVATPTNRRNIDVAGTSEAGARIAVSGASAPANGTADSTGRFTVPVTLTADTANTIVVIATDKAGNVSNPSTFVVTHSSTVPSPPTIDQPTPAPTKNAAYTLTGRVAQPAAGTTVQVAGGNGDVSGNSDASTGTFSVAVTLNENATNELHVTSKTGTIVSSEAVVTIVHDNTAPSAPDAAKTSVGKPGSCLLGRSSASITGAAGAVEAGATVKIVNTSNNNASVTVAATSQGAFSKSLSLCSGDSLKVTATDAAGNESSSTTKAAP